MSAKRATLKGSSSFRFQPTDLYPPLRRCGERITRGRNGRYHERQASWRAHTSTSRRRLYLSEVFPSLPDDSREPADSAFRRAAHESSHVLLGVAAGARIDYVDTTETEAHAGATAISFPDGIKADRNCFALTRALVALGGMASGQVLIGADDASQHEAGDLKIFRESVATCQGTWKQNDQLRRPLFHVAVDYLRAHEVQLAHVARMLKRYRSLKGVDAVTELRRVAPIEPLFVGNWEQALFRRMKGSLEALEFQRDAKALHQRFIKLCAQAV